MKVYTSQQLSSESHSAVLQEITLLVTQSFIEDANAKWLLAGDDRKEYMAGLSAYIQTLIRLALLSDASFTVITKDECSTPSVGKASISIADGEHAEPSSSLDVRAVCATIPPHGNKTFDSGMAGLRAGLLTAPFNIGVGFTYRLLAQFLPKMHKMHDDMFPDASTKYDNWHLFVVATHPENQGQGLGKRLLYAVQDMVKRANIQEEKTALATGKEFTPAPLYLEASNNINKRLYNRVGFEVRTTMVYGDLDGQENMNIGPNGRVIGGRMFGMVWDPQLREEATKRI